MVLFAFRAISSRSFVRLYALITVFMITSCIFTWLSVFRFQLQTQKVNRNVKLPGVTNKRLCDGVFMRWLCLGTEAARSRLRKRSSFWVNLVLLSQTWLEIVQMPRVASHLQIQKHRSFVWPPSRLAVTWPQPRPPPDMKVSWYDM